MPLDLLSEAILAGVLLGCFYAAVSIGLSIAFGLLDVPHIAHPAFLVLGAYAVYFLTQRGVDPLLAGVVLTPVFFLIGIVMYRFYHAVFERRGSDAALRGLAFFFGVGFIIEVGLIMIFGVDQRMVDAPYIGSSFALGEMRVPMRMLVAFAMAIGLTISLWLYLSKTYT
ncbi:MAG: branched-chain amino acid ABC transporter permease, partial [Betaproteobacteria bacterium]